MLKLGMMVNRKNLEKAFMAHYDRDPVRTMKALNKAIEEDEKKKARYAQIKRVVHRICDALYWEYPEEFTWMMRKSFHPCFSLGETVQYGKKGGAMRKATIVKLSDKGAYLIDSGVGREVPGEQIFKIQKSA
ncbi:hypothetical protein FACS189476_12790 [Spirochaetia bacterium]|nr:hypothetical protein FACS189476_12790 [Spirochaetia bacterium]